MDNPTDIGFPKSLKSPAVRATRLARLHEPHIKPLTDFVDQIRQETGVGMVIPYFNPLDGGTKAKCLFVGEAPGPQAVKSGFVSRDNPDNSARNFWELNKEAGIPRQLAVSWNIVPWYIGSGKKIRPANPEDIREGEVFLLRLLPLLPNLAVVVLSGNKARVAENIFRKVLPRVELVTMMHTSPLVINTNPDNRGKILAKLKYVAQILF